jgi:hypothetical protein
MKLVALLVLSLATVAHADPEKRVATATQYDGPPGAELDAPPVPADAPPPPPPTPLELARDRAVSSRGLVVGSALTVPEGHVEVTGRAMLPVGALANISAGLTSSTEIWADVGGLINFDDEESDSTKIYGFGMKQVLTHDHVRQFAITGSMHRIDGEPIVAASAVGSFCSDNSCDLLVSVSAGLAASRADTLPVFEGSLLTGSGVFHAAVELLWLGKAGVGIVGGRIGGSNVALDLGVGLPLQSGEKIVPLPMAGLGLRI